MYICEEVLVHSFTKICDELGTANRHKNYLK